MESQPHIAHTTDMQGFCSQGWPFRATFLHALTAQGAMILALLAPVARSRGCGGGGQGASRGR